MTTSQMQRELLEIPEAVARLLDKGGPAIRATAKSARDLDPAYIATIARGSSDHACTYLKYAAELTLGLPVASLGPSIASIYGARLKLGGALCLSVSQSGKSPDIVQLTSAARQAGALTVAVTNNPSSPLGEAAEAILDIHAGAELSVAATKTFVTSAVAGLAMIAEWAGDARLRAAIANLPAQLDAAARTDWSPLAEVMREAGSLYTIGRGPSFAISGEAALKFKETCQIHAESYSSAEVLHGPVSIVGADFPVLALTAADAAQESVVEVADALAGKGARVFATSDRARKATPLPFVRTDHPLTDPIALIVSFYAMVEQVARSRGVDPDTPRHLNKVTQTL